MNTILYEIWELGQSISMKSLCNYVDWKWYDSFKWKAQRWSLNLDLEQKKKVLEWVENKIRKLVKIKLLLDKEIEW